MQVDYVIVGQGICGTMLSWFLYKEGKSFIVLDNNAESSSSVAAGIINPVTGRRYVTSWMAEELMSFAMDTYTELGTHLNSRLIFQKDIIDFFPSPQMRDAFVNRITEDNTYVHTFPDQNHFNRFFNYDFGCGQIRPVLMANLSIILASWRKRLLELQSLMEENFDETALSIEKDSVHYKDIIAHKILFCDGISGMNNPWFRLLPFSANKGEALIIHSEELTNEHIFKKGLLVAPLPVQHTFWVGSNYQWEFENAAPSASFFELTKKHLENWLKVPFKILQHKAAIRPATVERRPFVGTHPHLPQLGILNGMGTKGTSLAPYFANQLVQHLVHGLPIAPEADVHRFSRILSK